MAEPQKLPNYSTEISTKPPSGSKRVPRSRPASTKKKPGFSNSTQLVTLVAGKDETKFIVHKDFACHYSPVFQVAFNSEFIEGQTQTYRLEATGITVQFLVHWIYNSNFDIEPEDPKSRGTERIANSWKFRRLVKLWVLADPLLMRGLQNSIIVELERLRQASHHGGTSLYAYIYENTSKDSTLRLYILHIAVCHMRKSAVVKHPDRFPHEMLLDMAMIFLAEADTKKMRKAVGLDKTLLQYKLPEDNENGN